MLRVTVRPEILRWARERAGSGLDVSHADRSTLEGRSSFTEVLRLLGLIRAFACCGIGPSLGRDA